MLSDAVPGKAIYGQVRKQVANVFDVENELLSRVLFSLLPLPNLQSKSLDIYTHECPI
jgi:hypothetical protein